MEELCNLAKALADKGPDVILLKRPQRIDIMKKYNEKMDKVMLMMKRMTCGPKAKFAGEGEVRLGDLGPLAKSPSEENTIFGGRENGMPKDGIHLGLEGSKGRPP